MSRCPGCGLALPLTDSGDDIMTRGIDASPACFGLQREVAAFEADHPALLAHHQLFVDAYGAQHPVGPRAIRVAYSLVGLHLALDRDWTGIDVRRLHGRMGKPRPDWPAFERPTDLGSLTILDVAEAGARAGSLEGHERALRAWAADVWAAWSDHHAEALALTTRFTD